MRFKSVSLNFLIIILITSISGCIEQDISQDTELLVLGVSGESKEFTLTNIKELVTIGGKSEYENSFGNWRGKGTYIGVLLSIFAEEVGGIQPGDILIVTSLDNYTQVFSYENIYPSAQWEAIQGMLILAYEFNNTEIPEWEDGLQIAFLPLDEQYSNDDQQQTATPESSQAAASTRWVKWVKKLEFIRE